MPRRFQGLHPVLSALPVLEAAARLGSFTRAGAELGLAQPTVSRHVINLEEHFGVPLFDRRHNRLTVTAAGRQLAEAVALGLGHIETTARSIRADSAPAGLTLACSFGFAHQWLMPRFSGLRRVLGEDSVQLVTSDWLDGLDVEAIDIIVSWTGKVWTDRPCLPLFPEIAVPVCSPALLERHPGLAGAGDAPEALLDAPLLHYDVRDSDFLTWPKWFAAVGLAYRAPAERYLFANYQFMVQAMLEGEGVGLGWRHMVDEPLADGRLVPVGPTVRRPAAAYTLEYRTGADAHETLDRVLAWFRDQAGAGGSA